MSDCASDAALVVFTTLANVDDAAAMARRLVNDRIVACGTVIGGVLSIYRWKGEVQEEREALVILKTRRERWKDLVDAVREDHPYEVPELLALSVEEGLTEYLAWVAKQTGDKANDA